MTTLNNKIAEYIAAGNIITQLEYYRPESPKSFQTFTTQREIGLGGTLQQIDFGDITAEIKKRKHHQKKKIRH